MASQYHAITLMIQMSLCFLDCILSELLLSFRQHLETAVVLLAELNTIL